LFLNRLKEQATLKKGLCRSYDLGLIDYAKALQLQSSLASARLSGKIPDVILFLQHPPVLTIGASGGEGNIIVPQDVLANEGVAVFYADRAGDITCHGPGQLVGYPIFDLKTKGRDLHQYVRNVEEVIIRALGDFSITAGRNPGQPGIWVGGEEICALGMQVSNWVTKHGFALNINNDLRHFCYINPCGSPGRGVISMSRLLGHEVIIKDVMLSIVKHSSQVFNIDIEHKCVRHLDEVLCFLDIHPG
jgi:lipoate-protein ligase B